MAEYTVYLGQVDFQEILLMEVKFYELNTHVCFMYKREGSFHIPFQAHTAINNNHLENITTQIYARVIASYLCGYF